jgi:GxxExxY protein
MSPSSENNPVHPVNPVQKSRQDEHDLQDISKLTEAVIGCAFKVHNTLGFGFLESVYEKSLIIELQKLGISAKSQEPIKVHYGQHIVGDFFADLLIDDRLIIELKSVSQLIRAHEVQLVNYLTATNIENGLLINFGPEKVAVKRKFKTPKKAE